MSLAIADLQLEAGLPEGSVKECVDASKHSSDCLLWALVGLQAGYGVLRPRACL